MVVQCSAGCGCNAVLKRPKTNDALCKTCFYWAFETEVHHTITSTKMFKSGQVVAIGASGGKDSTVLAYILKHLNEKYNYGLKLVLLSIDEGITGYRDDSLESVKRNQEEYNLPLTVLSYKDLYGWTMDDIVKQVGRKNNCTFCGVFRRQALERGAILLNCDVIATGHNADDVAETILMNLLRGDIARLQRCTSHITLALKKVGLNVVLPLQIGISSQLLPFINRAVHHVYWQSSEGSLPRAKPFKYAYEKEIVLYAYFKKLDYFATECVYAPDAYRGHARALVKDLEALRSTSIIDIIHAGEQLAIKDGVKLPKQGVCSACGFVSSNVICKACVLLEGLNRGRPKLAIGKSNKALAEILADRLANAASLSSVQDQF